jgi:hypothetical protein
MIRTTHPRRRQWAVVRLFFVVVVDVVVVVDMQLVDVDVVVVLVVRGPAAPAAGRLFPSLSRAHRPRPRAA